jgi:hypothetical protein
MMKSILNFALSGGFRFGLPAGIALVLITNLVVLAGVASNRRGEQTGRLTLSERELHLRRAYDYENSGVSLRLDWGQTHNWKGYGWLTLNKLTELGFDVSVDPDDEEAEEFYRDPLPIEAWIVLEFDGPAWQEHLESLRANVQKYLAEGSINEESARRIQRAQQALAVAEAMGSRLVVIDAGLDSESLRKRYPQMNRHLVVRGEIGIRRLWQSSGSQIAGYVSTPLITTIHVPSPYSKMLEPLDDTHNQLPGPRYEVDLAFGSRSEPWIEDLQRTAQGQ